MMRWTGSVPAALVLALAIGQIGMAAAAQQPRLPVMVEIPAGRFIMGAPPEADAQQGKPQHEVQVKAFRLSRTLVTFAQYDAFARATGRPLPQDDGLGRGDNPVVNVSRIDMLAYIDWLNRTSGQRGYRLASEAEWEYAAHAGTTTPFYWGDKVDHNRSNTHGVIDGDRWEMISPVASFPPNPWGLYDMAGNVWQMTDDCLVGDYRATPVDGSPYREVGCVIFMTRGGDYGSANRGQRTTARGAAGETFRSTSLGFRVAQDQPAGK